METDVNQVAESSPATHEEVTQEIDLSSLSRAQRQTWRETGEVPKPKSQPSAEDSAPSKSSEAAADKGKQAKNDAPASEAGKRNQEPPHRDTAEDRKAQLNAEIRDLLKQRDALKAEVGGKKDVKAEPSPAKPADSKPHVLEPPKKPKLDDFDSYDKYEEARDKYYEDLADYKAAKKLEDFQLQQAQEASKRALLDAVNDAKSRYADFEEKFKPTISEIAQNYGDMHPIVREMLDNSPVIADALYVLGGDSEQLASFINEAKANPAAAARRFALIERLVQDELAKGKEGKGEKPEKKEAGEKAPAKPDTAAPKPPAIVGGRSSATEEPDMAAARVGDFGGAKAEWNRRAREGRLR